MTELEKLEAGLEYCYDDKEVSARKENAIIQCRKYNAIDDTDYEAQYAQLKAMLGSVGEKVWIAKTFSCDKLTDNMIRLIAEKNIRLIEKTEIIAKKTLREKIMTYLPLQSQRCGITYFEITLDRTALADYLCADRSALSRELARMKDEGLIDYHKSTFRLLNVHM